MPGGAGEELMQIGVIGPGECSEATAALAEQVGSAIARPIRFYLDSGSRF